MKFDTNNKINVINSHFNDINLRFNGINARFGENEKELINLRDQVCKIPDFKESMTQSINTQNKII